MSYTSKIKTLGEQIAEMKLRYQDLRNEARKLNRDIVESNKMMRQLQKQQQEEQEQDNTPVCIEIVFKCNYLELFTKRGWIDDIECLHKADYKRYKALATAKKLHLEDLRAYATYLKVLQS